MHVACFSGRRCKKNHGAQKIWVDRERVLGLFHRTFYIASFFRRACLVKQRVSLFLKLSRQSMQENEPVTEIYDVACLAIIQLRGSICKLGIHLRHFCIAYVSAPWGAGILREVVGNFAEDFAASYPLFRPFDFPSVRR